MNETNWSKKETGTVKEYDIVGLERAKRYEKDLLKKGHRWIRINSRTKVLVECDADGKPTERGKRQIQMQQECFNVK